MNILEIIAKKRDAKELSKEEIEYFVKGYTDSTIQDYQAAALVMAIYMICEEFAWMNHPQEYHTYKAERRE